MIWKTLPGWFAPDDQLPDHYLSNNVHRDAALIAEAVSAVRSEKRVVEIGSYAGRSAFFMWELLTYLGRGDVVVHCYDPYIDGTESDGAQERSIQEARRIFEAAIAEHKPNIALHIKDGAEADDGPEVDLLHVDGEHTYEQVRKELAAWKPYLSPICSVIFDDWHSYGGIRQATFEVLSPKEWALMSIGYSRVKIMRIGLGKG